MCKNEVECIRERERERERGGEGRAIHVLLIYSIFVVAFFFTLRTVYVFCIRYKIMTSSAVTRIEVSPG